ncbi:hypothetical protein AB0M22_09040 [Nocardia sp. NPDC051756]|uniref:hypothetical protein n=1 Tax=Nocardia sp. NPDC051756 TaxID=3154751 RepID=UPI00342AD2DE
MPAEQVLLIMVVAIVVVTAIAAIVPGKSRPAPIHSAVGPYTPDEAHVVWQEHADCVMNSCPALHTAYWTLVDSGKLVADARAVR